MKANELMLGDLLKPKNVDSYFKVGFIGVDSIWNDTDTAEWYLDEIEPIPLTSEILEKNGFRKLVTYGTEKWLCDTLRLNVYSSDGTWRFCADTNRNENSVIYIRFVHELQHALRLCQIEKEIEL